MAGNESLEVMVGRIDERTKLMLEAQTDMVEHLRQINGTNHKHELRIQKCETHIKLMLEDVKVNKKRIATIIAAIAVLAGATGVGVNQVVRLIVGIGG